MLLLQKYNNQNHLNNPRKSQIQNLSHLKLFQNLLKSQLKLLKLMETILLCLQYKRKMYLHLQSKLHLRIIRQESTIILPLNLTKLILLTSLEEKLSLKFSQKSKLSHKLKMIPSRFLLLQHSSPIKDQ